MSPPADRPPTNPGPRIPLTVGLGRPPSPHAPISAAEMAARGWDAVDVVFVTGDAYVDHPSFAMAILHRVLEAAGFRVAILSQPAWQTCDPWRQFGRPRLFFAVSAGNMDSLINHYTANKKVRNDDAYSPGRSRLASGDRIGPRWRIASGHARGVTRACRSLPAASRPVAAAVWPITTTGATRSAARSCWTAKPTCWSTAWANRTSSRSPDRMAAGKTVRDLRDLRGVAYALGAAESAPARHARGVVLSAVAPPAPSHRVAADGRTVGGRSGRAALVRGK